MLGVLERPKIRQRVVSGTVSVSPVQVQSSIRFPWAVYGQMIATNQKDGVGAYQTDQKSGD